MATNSCSAHVLPFSQGWRRALLPQVNDLRLWKSRHSGDKQIVLALPQATFRSPAVMKIKPFGHHSTSKKDVAKKLRMMADL